MQLQSNVDNTAPRFPASQNVARATMSTQEIAQLTGKAHKNIIRDVRTMLAALAADGSDLSHVRQDVDSRNYTTAYHLDRELTETLITGYDVALRHRVIRRLHELEGQVVGLIAIPSNLPDALRLAAEMAEKAAGLAVMVAEQAPKVAALERLQDASGTLCMTDAAKHLNVPRHRLIRWLAENRWMYRRANSRPWLAYQPRIEQGLAWHKVSVIGTDDDGDRRCASQFRITAKGLARLAEHAAKGDI